MMLSKPVFVLFVALGGSLLLSACGSSGSSVNTASGGGGSGTAGQGGSSVVAAGGDSSSGGASGSAMSAGGAAGAAGSGGTVVLTAVTCEKDRPFQNNAEIAPDVPKTINGSNGSFKDQCDPSGNLVEYVCEGTQVCSGVPNPDCKPGPETGKVVMQAFDCTGHCKDGACPSRCAQAGDLVHFESIGGMFGRTITVRNLTDGRRYTCEDPSGPPPADPTCHAMSLVGRDIAVIQSDNPFCTGSFAGLTVAIKHDCGVPNCSDCAYGSCQVLY